MTSTNLLERLHEASTRRLRVVRLIPNPARCRRRVRARCADTHAGWLDDHRYLNMDFLKEQKKNLLQTAASVEAKGLEIAEALKALRALTS